MEIARSREERLQPALLSRFACLGVAMLAFATMALSAPPADARVTPSADSRYTLANGCFALRSAQTGNFVRRTGPLGYAAAAASPSAGERFRMQATDLGRYLFYSQAPDFLALNLLNGVAPAAKPSNDSDWTVDQDGAAFTIVNGFKGRQLSVGAGGTLVSRPAGSAGAAGRFTFVPADGCAAYPEVQVNVEGTPSTGSTAFGETRGMVEGHMHMMAFEFLGGGAHCGRPWHRFGAPYALVDCADHTATGGCGAILENVLYGNPARCHAAGGWPTFAGWPAPRSLTHEQSYYKWLERAYRGGLRIFVNLLVENRVLCELYPLPALGKNSCNEMQSVRLQAQRLQELERYIDAQNGGPGEGWFRIVRDPFEARRVVNSGKLAVVMGMEVSEPFGCRVIAGAPQCTAAQLDAGIDELHALGVRQLELINKFDNALAGVAGDSGTTGTITNVGNFASTGSFYDLDTCADPHNADHSPTAIEHNDDLIIGNGLDALLPGAPLPIYPPGPHCNKVGLSTLGERAVRRIMTKRMIFDPDHMSVAARNQALDVVESENYAGVISSHSWSTENALPRIYGLGGVITPYAGDSQGFVEKWRILRKYRDRLGDQFFGVGYGADMNGLGGQGEPRGAGVPNPVTYPFTAFDGSVIRQQVSGQKTFDINRDGVAHYGMYPDWVQDLRVLAGDEIVEDMARGAEAYLQTWERAYGVPEMACRTWRGSFKTGGLAGRVRLGAESDPTLYSAGQPQRRTQAWSWCAQSAAKAARAGKKVKRPSPRGRVVAVYGADGTVGMILSSLASHRAAGVGPRTSAKSLPKGTRKAAKNLWVRSAGKGARYVYVVRKGRVAYAGIAKRSLAGKARILREQVKRAGI
jgi:microsomal dipeptidase-like Zn-dependent dipeptidase